MRALMLVVGLWTVAPEVMAQPAADCPVVPAPPGPSMPVTIDPSGRPGVPSGVNGQAWVNVPLQTPRMDCGALPEPPEDVLRGPPGDLLRGTPWPAGER